MSQDCRKLDQTERQNRKDNFLWLVVFVFRACLHFAATVRYLIGSVRHQKSLLKIKIRSWIKNEYLTLKFGDNKVNLTYRQNHATALIFDRALVWQNLSRILASGKSWKMRLKKIWLLFLVLEKFFVRPSFLFPNTFEWFVSFPVSLFLVFIFDWLDPTLIWVFYLGSSSQSATVFFSFQS